MENDFKKNIIIVGLGLIGGSIAKSLYGKIEYNVYAIDKDEVVLKKAYDMNLIKNEKNNKEYILKISDIVIICLYPEDTVNFIRNNINLFKKNSIITDSCGLKDKIMSKLKSIIRDDLTFIGGHPMTGKETIGFLNSDKNLFDNSNYVLVNYKNEVNSNKLNELVNLIREFGNVRIVITDSEKHDNFIAYTSHLPHVLACILVDSPYEYEEINNFIGSSFKDFIRIANINDKLWTDLMVLNKKNLIKSIEEFEKKLGAFKSKLEDKEKLSKYLINTNNNFRKII